MDALREQLPGTAEVIAQDAAAGFHRGGQFYVSLRGRTVVNTAFGDAAPGVPMRTDSLVSWLSAGKPITAMAIARLWQQNLLSLDEKVADYIPDFAQHGKEAITLRHILTHTAGFPTFDAGYPQVDWTESLGRIAAAELDADWIPGRTAGYHVSGSWFILGEIIERVTGQSFESYVRTEILQPLGMANTMFSLSDADREAAGDRIGWMWRRVRRDLEPLDWHEPPRISRPSPGSSARGPISELGRFYETLLRHFRRIESGREVSPFTSQTVEAVTSPHRVGLFDRTFQQTIDFGLGFLVDSNRYGAETVPYGFGRHSSSRAFGHGGAQTSIGFADPEHELVVAWAMNAQIGEPRHNQRNREINSAIYRDLNLASLPD